MKKLEIKTNKRLLIVEYPNDKSFQDDLSFYRQFKIGGFEQYIVEFICKGSDLTDDIAKGFFTYEQKFNNFNRFIEGYRLGCALHHTSLSAFISAIQSKNYHWG